MLTILNLGRGAISISVHRGFSVSRRDTQRKLLRLSRRRKVGRTIILSAYGHARVCTILGRRRSGRRLCHFFLALSKGDGTRGRCFFFCANARYVHRLFQIISKLSSVILNRDRVLGRVGATCAKTLTIRTAHAVLGALFRHTVAAKGEIHARAQVSADTISIDCTTIGVTRGVLNDLRKGGTLIFNTNSTTRLLIGRLRKEKLERIVIAGHRPGQTRRLTHGFSKAALPFRRTITSTRSISIFVATAKTARCVIGT